MSFEKLLKLTIVDALDRVWSESGVIPSKKTRRTIMKAAEKISNDVEEDFSQVNEKAKLAAQKWRSFVPIKNRRIRTDQEPEPEPLGLS